YRISDGFKVIQVGRVLVLGPTRRRDVRHVENMVVPKSITLRCGLHAIFHRFPGVPRTERSLLSVMGEAVPRSGQRVESELRCAARNCQMVTTGQTLHTIHLVEAEVPSCPVGREYAHRGG